MFEFEQIEDVLDNKLILNLITYNRMYILSNNFLIVLVMTR
jgi:hypothetical protein